MEIQFQRALNEIGRSLQGSIEGLSDPFDILSTIKSLLRNMTFHQYAEEIAKMMVVGLFNSGEKTWREAARENSNGRVIYDALRRELQGPVGGALNFQIQRNAELIKSLPLDMAKEVAGYISDESIKGRRAGDIADDLRVKFPSMTKNKATLIARTETSKTSTALTQARAESVGLAWYSWETSQDARVRSSHRHMSGVLVRFDNPPSPEGLISMKSTLGRYNAGDCPNCRCFPAPVVNLDYVKWPHKVYQSGTITTMTRSQFERLGG